MNTQVFDIYDEYKKAVERKDVQKLESLFDETKDRLFCTYPLYLPDWMIIKLLELIPHKMCELPVKGFLKMIIDLENCDEITTEVRCFVLSRFLEVLDEISEKDKESFSERITLPSEVFPLNLSIFGLDFVDLVLRVYKKVPIRLRVEALPVLAKSVTCEQFEEILINSKLADTYKTKIFDELPDAYFEIMLKLIKERKLNISDTYLSLPERTPQQFLDENFEVIWEYIDEYSVEKFIVKKGLNKRFSLFAVETAKRIPELIANLGEENFAALVNSSHPQGRTFYAMLLRNPYIKNHPQVFLKALKSYCELKTSYYYELEIPDEILLKLSPKQVLNLLTKNLDDDGESGLKMNPEILKEKIAVIALSQPEKVKPILGKLEAYEKRCKYNKSGVEIICDFLGISAYCDCEEISDDGLVAIFDKINSIKDVKVKEELFLFVFRYLRGDYKGELELRFKDLVQEILERA